MSLDRESIERKDFPVDKRGYNPAAVHAHLSQLADEVDEFKRGLRHSQAQTLASAVSEQVRGIVEAAESSAAEILRGAELEAQEIRAQASRATEQATGDAQRVRERAAAQAREYVGRLSSSISALLGRLDAIDSELNALTASLRGDTERLRGELAALEDELEGAMAASEVSGPAPPVGVSPSAWVAADVSEPMPPPVAMPEPAPEGVTQPAPEGVTQPAPEGVGGPARERLTESVAEGVDLTEAAAERSSQPAKIGDEPVLEPVTATGAGTAPEPPASAAPSAEETEGARLIALNMALNGTPREETERYLAENYNLADRQRLLDEVYTSVQG
jgi:DivIVA domain-containing protein